MAFPLPQNKCILYGVLNWGLGHASRSIPIIQKLLELNNTVILASDGEVLGLLQNEFPQLEIISLPPYRVRYTSKLWSIVIKNIPNIALAIFREHLQLMRLIKAYRPNIVISDSRFGFYTTEMPCYIISHQLKLKSSSSLLGYAINLVNTFLLNRFTEVWVPDSSDRKLSGDLSINKKIRKTRFIGSLSRMVKADLPMLYDLCIILSGPEPSRSILEKKLILSLSEKYYQTCFIRGTQLGPTITFSSSWNVIDLADTKEINHAISSSRIVISRSGYSSILDYYKLETSAILIPTPGQSEQEYLAERLDGKYGFWCIKENKLDKLEDLLSGSE